MFAKNSKAYSVYLLDPIGRMDGDSLPVSAFNDYVDGTFEHGASGNHSVTEKYEYESSYELE